MTYKYNWENPTITGENRMDARATFYRYESKEDALTQNSDQVTGYQLLNGVWNFQLFQTVLQGARFVDSLHAGEVKAEDMQDLKVPANWQMEGLDDMHYADLL